MIVDENVNFFYKVKVLAITTPVIKDIDFVFPGEDWFFYWKTSAALWESKLRENVYGERVIIPINWAFHSETGDNVDFGDNRPETDLLKLFSIITKIGKKFTVFLPLSPVPFLPNGGIPFLVAKTVCLNSEELVNVVVDADGNMNKMFSFFEPKVYQSFHHFISKLAAFFDKNSIASTIWGIDCGCVENNKYISYFEDGSSAFKKGFRRFLTVKKNDENLIIDDPVHEDILRKEFADTLRDLYLESATEIFGDRWEGVLNISFIGGNSLELMNRMAGNYSQGRYSKEAFTAITCGAIPSSILLPTTVKDNGVISKILSGIVERPIVETFLEHDYYVDDLNPKFRPLYFCEIVNSKSFDSIAQWNQLGLIEFLNQSYGYNYLINDVSKIETGEVHSQIYFFSGIGMDSSLFGMMIKIFMNGGKIVFNSSALSDELERRLELFLIENSLKINHANFITKIRSVELGEGKFIIFDGQTLTKKHDSISNFWGKILDVFAIKSLNVKNEDGLNYFWLTRSSLMNELSYEEVRRFSVFNTTSYRKKIRISLIQNFALTKIVDEINAKVSTGHSEVEIDLGPGGSVSIDFGLFN